MEIDDSIFGKKLKSPFGIDSPLLHGCPFRHPLCLPHLTATTTARYLRPGLLSTANFSACMEAWARWLPRLKKKKKTYPAAHTDLSQTPFLHALSSLNCHQTSKHLKPEGLFSALLPAGCWVAI